MTPLLSFDDNVAVITLNRPESLNALSFAIMSALNELLSEVERSEARGLIITGAGSKAFSAGADIRELRHRTMREQRESTQYGQAVFRRLEQLRQPSLALINGYAFGGGLELAMACTFRLAHKEAKMGLPEIKLGLIPGYGGTQRLPRLVGQGRALDMILSGRTVSAVEAEQIGLVNGLVEDASILSAKTYLGPILEYSQVALNLARSAVARAFDKSLSEGQAIETDLSTLAFQSRDSEEGMMAFLEKRKAVFNDV